MRTSQSSTGSEKSRHGTAPGAYRVGWSRPKSAGNRPTFARLIAYLWRSPVVHSPAFGESNPNARRLPGRAHSNGTELFCPFHRVSGDLVDRKEAATQSLSFRALSPGSHSGPSGRRVRSSARPILQSLRTQSGFRPVRNVVVEGPVRQNRYRLLPLRSGRTSPREVLT